MRRAEEPRQDAACKTRTLSEQGSLGAEFDILRGNLNNRAFFN